VRADGPPEAPEPMVQLLALGEQAAMGILVEIIEVQSKVELIPHLRERTERYHDEAVHLGGLVAAEAFRNVRHHGHRGPLDLIMEPEISTKGAAGRRAIDRDAQSSGPLPDVQILEARHLRHIRLPINRR
jgi:hypothetical protein